MFKMFRKKMTPEETEKARREWEVLLTALGEYRDKLVVLENRTEEEEANLNAAEGLLHDVFVSTL